MIVPIVEAKTESISDVLNEKNRVKIPVEFHFENKEDLEKAKETAAELVALLKEAKELIRSLSLKDD